MFSDGEAISLWKAPRVSMTCGYGSIVCVVVAFATGYLPNGHGSFPIGFSLGVAVLPVVAAITGSKKWLFMWLVGVVAFVYYFIMNLRVGW